MRIGFISCCGAQDLFLLHELRGLYPDVCVVRPVFTHGAAAPGAARVARWLSHPSRVVRQRLEREARSLRMDRRDEALRARLFGDAMPALTAHEIPRTQLNTEATGAYLREQCLDLIIVAGAPLLKPVVHAAARFGSINVHYGISPRFRGEDTLFWALYEQRYDALGITLHAIDEGVDTGPVFAQVVCARREDAREVDVWEACARAAASELRALLATFERALADDRAPPHGIYIPGTSRQYFRRERLWSHEAALVLRRFVGDVCPALAEPIVRRFY